MRNLVVDSSVCMKWAFEEEGSEIARRILTDYQNDKILLFSPAIWEYEIVNALASAVHRKKISPLKSTNYLNLFIQSKPQIISLSDLLKPCLENTNRYQISAYDSAYVTMAKENKMLFISADEKLVRKIKDSKTAILLKDYS